VGRIGCFEIDMRDGKSVGTPAFFELYGLPGDKGSWTQQEWLSFVHPEDRASVIAHLMEVALGAETTIIEYRVVRADGEVRWTATRARVETDSQGRQIRAYGIQQDITERKLVELALAESELLHRSILNASNDCIKLIALDGRLELMNGSGAQGLELDDAQQVVGRDWVGLWPEEARAGVAAALAEARAGRAARFTDCCPRRRVRRNGGTSS
jgi:PAS domain S-box-containing protein